MELPLSVITLYMLGAFLDTYGKGIRISIANMPILPELSSTGISSRAVCPIKRQPRSTST